MFDIKKNRESIEWSNTWIEDAKDLQKKRILIIGDSVAREFRGSLSRFLPNYAIDFIGSSSIFEDSLLYDVCDIFFKNKVYQYSAILFNIGGKHGYYLNTVDKIEDKQKFASSFAHFVSYLQTHVKTLINISTPPSKYKNNIRLWDEDINKEIKKRNAIQSEIAHQFNISTIDLYDFVIKHNFKYKDVQHFSSKQTQRLIAQHIIRQLIKHKLLDCKDFYYKKNYLGILKIVHTEGYIKYFLFNQEIMKREDNI